VLGTSIIGRASLPSSNEIDDYRDFSDFGDFDRASLNRGQKYQP
jgi:hypothetical protein